MTHLRTVVVGSLVAMLFGGGCSSGVGPDDESPTFEGPGDDEVTSEGPEQLLGRFDVSVRINDGEPLIEITPNRAFADLQAQAEVSILGAVSVVNDSANPPAWNAGTETLEGFVRVRNNTGTARDEPNIKITSLTNDPGGDAQFLDTDYGSGTRLGARYGYSDLATTGSSPASRFQPKRRWVVNVPGGLDFSFTIDVLGKDVASVINTDNDDDSFNTEAASQPQGGDCNDSNAAVNPDAGGGSSSTCSTGVCTETCQPGCPCSYTVNGGAQLKVNCVSNSDCDTTCNGASVCNVLGCGSNAMCDQTCTGTTNSCLQSGCSPGSNCSNTCTNTPTCWTKACSGANCDVDCTNGVNCRLDNCANGANCTESCTSSSNCRLGCKASAASCALTCDGTTPCVLTCEGGFGPNCTMDCNGGAPVDCPDGVTRVCNRACP